MNRQQLVDAVGERLGDRKTAAVAVEAVLDTVTGALAEGERVALFGFGVFEKVDRAARTARNPSTGGTVEVPATAVPRFRPGQALKDAVNGPSSRTGASAPARRAPADTPPKRGPVAAEPAAETTAGATSDTPEADKPATSKADKAKGKGMADKGDKGRAKGKADGKKKGKKG